MYIIFRDQKHDDSPVKWLVPKGSFHKVLWSHMSLPVMVTSALTVRGLQIYSYKVSLGFV